MSQISLDDVTPKKWGFFEDLVDSDHMGIILRTVISQGSKRRPPAIPRKLGRSSESRLETNNYAITTANVRTVRVRSGREIIEESLPVKCELGLKFSLIKSSYCFGSVRIYTDILDVRPIYRIGNDIHVAYGAISWNLYSYDMIPVYADFPFLEDEDFFMNAMGRIQNFLYQDDHDFYNPDGMIQLGDRNKNSLRNLWMQQLREGKIW